MIVFHRWCEGLWGPCTANSLQEECRAERWWLSLQIPSGQRQAIPYALTLGPPFLLSLTFPDLFFSALDFAGTYGVLTLFGLLPVAMAWSERYEVNIFPLLEK